MSSPDKPRFRREAALEVAQEIYDNMKQFCTRCKIVGSLRRGKKFVGDVECIFVGKVGTRKDDLFEITTFNEALEQIDYLVKRGLIAKRPNINGHLAWGDKNRLAIHVRTKIPVDFFASTEPAWFNMLVMRTGGQKNNTLLAQAYRRKGLRWAPYEAGFYGPGGMIHENRSEEDVYRNAGLRFLQPQERP